MKLFKYEDYNMVISDEAMLLSPFKKLWDRDESKDKYKALLELGYVYFMEDPRSDYLIYIDEKERSKLIVLGLGMPKGWKPDKDVKEAQKFYSSFKSEAALLLDDVRAAISKLREYIVNIDLNAVDKNGKPLYTLNTYTSTISQIPKLVVSLDEAEKAIAKEMAQNDNVRGSLEKSMFEDI